MGKSHLYCKSGLLGQLEAGLGTKTTKIKLDSFVMMLFERDINFKSGTEIILTLQSFIRLIGDNLWVEK